MLNVPTSPASRLAAFLVFTATAATAQTVGVMKLRPESMTCDRPLQAPHVLSRKGNEAQTFQMTWAMASKIRYMTAPVIVHVMHLCLEKAKAQGGPWDVLKPVEIKVVSEPELGRRRVHVTGMVNELYLALPNDVPPWDLAQQINDFVVESAFMLEEDDKQRIDDALWTLWLESFLATMPMEQRGIDLRKFYHHSYVDQLEAPRDENAKSIVPSWDAFYNKIGQVGYLRVGFFAKGTSQKFRDVLAPRMVEDGVRSLIVDLRGNDGGETQHEFVDFFLRPGNLTIVEEQVGTGTLSYRRRPAGAPFYDLPLVVLVNRDTASMAEVFVAGVHANRRGLIIGETTWGKGLSIDFVTFNEGMTLLPRSIYFEPGRDESWHGKGLAPHMEVPPGKDRARIEESLSRPSADLEEQMTFDPVLRTAVQVLMTGHEDWRHLLKPYGGSQG